MPPIIVAVGAVVGAIGVGTTVALAVGIAAAGFSFYSAQKAKKMAQGGNTAAERKQTFRASNAPKQVVLGSVEVSGPLVFVMESGSPDDSGAGEIIDLVVPLAGHPCAKCLSIRVGDAAFTKAGNSTDGSHWVLDKDGTRHGEVWFYSRPATATSAPPSLANVSQWSADMIGQGQTFVHARLRSDNTQWPAGVEDVVAHIQGALINDPRSGKAVWSDNPALQGLHYIRHYLLVPDEHILLDSFIQAANICDEIVRRGSGDAEVSEARYRCHAIFDEETDPQQVLGNIAATMAGEFIRAGGMWGARAGAYDGPITRTLTMSEVMGSLDIRISLPLEDRINTVTGQYLEPEQGFNLTDFPSISQDAYVNEDGRERVEDLSFDFVHSVTQAQALAWIELEKRRRGATVSGTFALSAIDAVVSRVVQIDVPALVGLEFRVISWKLDPAGSGITLELIEDHPDIWHGNPAAIVPPLLPGQLSGNDPRVVATPTKLSFERTPNTLNQHGILSWHGNAYEYEVSLYEGDTLLQRQRVPVALLPLTVPSAENGYRVTVVALNAFGARSATASTTVHLSLEAPTPTVKLINSYDQWCEVSWDNHGADAVELELLNRNGQGVFRTVAVAAPVTLGWFAPAQYTLRLRASLGITTSAWSNTQLTIITLNVPQLAVVAETKDPLSSAGMLSFSEIDPRSERIEYQVSGIGFTLTGDCNGAPVRLPSMLPAVYEFKARSQWRDVFSPWSALKVTLVEEVPMPTELRFSLSEATGLLGTLNWQSSAKSHRLIITRIVDEMVEIDITVSGTQYQVPVLIVGDYQVQVIALGRVEQSEAAIITLRAEMPDPPQDVLFTAFATDPSYLGVVTWTAADNSSGYALRLKTQDEVILESRTSDNRWLIGALPTGSYIAEVAAISRREHAISGWSQVSFAVSGLAAPSQLSAVESLSGSGIQIISQVLISWQAVAGAERYDVEYQALGSFHWNGVQSSAALSATLNAIPTGQYTVRVRASGGTKLSGYSTLNFEVVGCLRPPAPLTNLRLHAQAGISAQLSWDLSPNPDVISGGAIHVRYTHLSGDQALWATAIPVTDRLPGNATLTSVPLKAGTYLVKPVNAAGFWAEQEVKVQSNMAGLLGYNAVVQREEPTTWAGEKNKAIVESSGALTLIQGKTGWSMSYAGETVPENAVGEIVKNDQPPYYVMAEPLDMGAIITARVTLESDHSLYIVDSIDERTDPIDSWPMFDGVTPDNVTLKFEMSQTLDDPQAASAVWSEWTPFLMGDFRARGFRLRVILTGNMLGSAATITALRLIADVPDRIERNRQLLAPADGLRVQYSTPFLAPAAIGITAHNLAANGRFVLSNEDNRGFDIQFYNGDSPISAEFTYTAISYGEAQ